MTNLQAFVLGIMAAWMPSFSVLALLFWRALVFQSHPDILPSQPTDLLPRQMLRIIRGGRDQGSE
jgi:hypothetical protein